MPTIVFHATKEEAQTIRHIVTRAIAMGAMRRINVEPMAAMMDITAVHSNGCRLRLNELLAADDFNFAHDVFGIFRHIDRETGKLWGYFVPRFAEPERA